MVHPADDLHNPAPLSSLETVTIGRRNTPPDSDNFPSISGAGAGAFGLEREGDHIGPYRLLALLGEGGFGNVWHAEQTRPVRREVALKVIKAGMDTQQVIARFDQERQALASMDHPNIATMIDAGVSPHGRPYFAMELVKGSPLTVWCREKKAPLQERLRIFHQVCLAVQHAHQKGIIHRDLKPSNILVTSIDSQPAPKVIDFGLAKAVRADDTDHTILTYAGDLLGTPRYMSPEQIERRTVIDTRSDIYSLGLLLYELLTGRLPHGSRKALQDLKQQITEGALRRPSSQIKHAHKEMRQPGDESSGKTPPSLPFVTLPSDLDWITMRALETERDRRYQTAAEFAADIQRFLNNEPVLACPPSVRYLTVRWIRRNRVVFAAACLAMMAMVSGTSVALWQAQHARISQHRAEMEAAQARQAEERAEAAQRQVQETAEFITRLLDRVGLEVQNGRNPEALKAALAHSNEEIFRIGNDPRLRVELLEKVLDIYCTIGESKLAIPLAASRAREIAALHGTASPEAFDAELRHIKMVVDFGARATGPDLILDLRRRVEAAGGHGSKFWTAVQRQLSRAWIKLDIPDKALAAAEELIAECRKQNLTPRSMVSSKLVLATALEFAQRYGDALDLLEQTRSETNDPKHLVRIDERLIFLLQRKGDFKYGADLLRKQLAELRAAPQADQGKVFGLLILLAEFESRSAQHEVAIVHAQEALLLAHERASTATLSVMSTYPEVLQALWRLSDCESPAGQKPEAISHAEEALRLARKMDHSKGIVHGLQKLSDLHRDTGSLDLAYDLMSQSHDLIRLNGASQREAESTLRQMCLIRLEQNRPAEALAMGLKLWDEVTQLPDSGTDIHHRGEIAETLLRSMKAQQAAVPGTPDPLQRPAWEAAADAARTPSQDQIASSKSPQ